MLRDYSGNYLPEMRLERFSKGTLIELLRLYSRLYMALDGFWYLAVKERNGNEEALACDLWVWEKASKYELARVTKLMKIEGNDVAALARAFQVGPWFWNLEYDMEVKNKNHAVLTVSHCPTLVTLEKEGTGREDSICNLMEPKFFKDYASFFDSDIQVKCLKSPPRESKNDICCRWEFKLYNKDEAKTSS